MLNSNLNEQNLRELNLQLFWFPIYLVASDKTFSMVDI